MTATNLQSENLANALANNLVIFAHGMESGPQGSKINALTKVAKAMGWATESPDYSHTKDFNERVEYLLALNLPCLGSKVLVGSSMGGYVMAHAADSLKPDGLFLMAPALYYPGYDSEPAFHPANTVVVHGWQDDVVPVERAKRYAEPRQVDLHLVNAGHTLNERLPLICGLFRDLLERVSPSD